MWPRRRFSYRHQARRRAASDEIARDRLCRKGAPSRRRPSMSSRRSTAGNAAGAPRAGLKMLLPTPRAPETIRRRLHRIDIARRADHVRRHCPAKYWHHRAGMSFRLSAMHHRGPAISMPPARKLAPRRPPRIGGAMPSARPGAASHHYDPSRLETSRRRLGLIIEREYQNQ